jgi:hypothetical protein
LWDNELGSFSWENSPRSLHTISLGSNGLSSFSWKNSPRNLHNIDLGDNELCYFSFDNVPGTLQYLDIQCNELCSFSWENAPPDLRNINLWDNPGIGNLSSFSFNGCPLNLSECKFSYTTYSYKQYQMAMKIKRFYKKRHIRRKYCANVITRGCHNWVWKPKCKDLTIGIRPRLDMLALGVE